MVEIFAPDVARRGRGRRPGPHQLARRIDAVLELLPRPALADDHQQHDGALPRASTTRTRSSIAAPRRSARPDPLPRCQPEHGGRRRRGHLPDGRDRASATASGRSTTQVHPLPRLQGRRARRHRDRRPLHRCHPPPHDRVRRGLPRRRIAKRPLSSVLMCRRIPPVLHSPLLDGATRLLSTNRPYLHYDALLNCANSRSRGEEHHAWNHAPCRMGCRICTGDRAHRDGGRRRLGRPARPARRTVADGQDARRDSRLVEPRACGE